MEYASILTPADGANEKLRQYVRPRDWVNPAPSSSRYNLVVIGGGTAGLVAAAGAAGLGAKVALVERSLLGGDCLNVGCVPSKALLRSARAVADCRRATEFGVTSAANASVDFPAVMERMRRLRADISPHDSAARFRDLGVDVFFGEARFTSRDCVSVEGTALRFAKAVIATGTRPAEPPVPGLRNIPYLTNESVFSLTELPRRLAVVGAGPIGCELAQAFARFGSQVTLIETAHGVLPREDRDGAEIIQASLERDGIRVLCCGRNLRITRGETGLELKLESHSEDRVVVVDQLLVATGRAPNVEELGLDAAGVRCDSQGVAVNRRLQTSNPSIYAAGDVCSRYKFTHAADAMARLVLKNALFFGRSSVDNLQIPWCTYTDPELAHIGITEQQTQADNVPLRTLVQPLQQVDRAIVDGEEAGFVKIHLAPRNDKILGATVVARHAGELIAELTLAMTAKLGLKTIAKTIHPYPTTADAIRKVGDSYNRTRLTPFVKGLLDKWLTWTR